MFQFHSFNTCHFHIIYTKNLQTLRKKSRKSSKLVIKNLKIMKILAKYSPTAIAATCEEMFAYLMKSETPGNCVSC